MNTFEKVDKTFKVADLGNLVASDAFIFSDEVDDDHAEVYIALSTHDKKYVKCGSLRPGSGMYNFKTGYKVIPVDLEIKWSYS